MKRASLEECSQEERKMALESLALFATLAGVGQPRKEDQAKILSFHQSHPSYS
jgi:hypothetical protein